MSVVSRSSVLVMASGGAREKDEGRNTHAAATVPATSCFLASEPGQVLNQQDADATQEMQREQEH